MSAESGLLNPSQVVLEKQPVDPQDGNNLTEQTQKGLEVEAQAEPQLQELPNEKDLNNSSEKKLLDDSKCQKIHEVKVEPDLKGSATESFNKSVSATTKALEKIKAESVKKKKTKKPVKTSVAFKKKKFNEELSKVLVPKSAIILLHEIKPNCVFKVLEMSDSGKPSFCAQIEHNNIILGIGYGTSKSQAKNSAAENVIKAIVLKAMSSQPGSATETDEKKINVNKNEDDSFDNLPWAGLASFAMFKMFSEWQVQHTASQPLSKHASKEKFKSKLFIAKKKLPPNAAELHPSAVLNIMHPELTAVEVERKDGPTYQVKMEYTVNGKVYAGVGRNKKEAKKVAAKAVLSSLYGLFENL